MVLMARISCLCPASDEIVINPGQTDNFLIVADLPAQTLDGGVEFEQHDPRRLVLHHALDPEEGAPAAASGHRSDMMAAGGGIEHQVPSRQLDRMTAECVFDHQLAAVIIRRI